MTRHIDIPFRVSPFAILDEELRGAVRGGINKFYKYHGGSLTEEELEAMVGQVHDYVMDVVCERFDLGGSDDRS